MLEELQGNECVVTHELFAEDEGGDTQPTHDVAGDRVQRVPAPVATLLGHEQQRHEGDDDGCRTPPVDAHGAPGVWDVQEPQNHRQGDHAHRQVEEEDPAPTRNEQNLVGAREQATDERADEARHSEHREEIALVLGALARGEDVAHDRERQGHEATSAEALNRAEDRELVHRRREAGRERAHKEDADRDDEQRAATENVAELAVDGSRDRRRDQVGGRHPRLEAQAIEVVRDGAHRRSHDGLIERRQEHSRHQTEDHEEYLAVGHNAAGVGDRLCLLLALGECAGHGSFT